MGTVSSVWERSRRGGSICSGLMLADSFKRFSGLVCLGGVGPEGDDLAEMI